MTEKKNRKKKSTNVNNCHTQFICQNYTIFYIIYYVNMYIWTMIENKHCK